MTSAEPLSEAVKAWLADRHQAVLITIRGDGSPQSSNLAFAFDGDTARISVTADRAKTRNIERDPRVVLHVLGDSFWQYAAVQGTAQLSAVSGTPGDAVGRELLDIYQAISGPHGDPEEFFRAMVDDRRLVLTVRPHRAVTFNIG